jgi:hypothetical protein
MTAQPPSLKTKNTHITTIHLTMNPNTATRLNTPPAAAPGNASFDIEALKLAIRQALDIAVPHSVTLTLRGFIRQAVWVF